MFCIYYILYTVKLEAPPHLGNLNMSILYFIRHMFGTVSQETYLWEGAGL